MKSFFPMRGSEAATLVFLIAFSAFAFIPAWRTVELGGMALFGWLIAVLMLISPALALTTFLRRGGGSRGGRDPASVAGLASGPGSGEGPASSAGRGEESGSREDSPTGTTPPGEDPSRSSGGHGDGDTA